MESDLHIIHHHPHQVLPVNRRKSSAGHFVEQITRVRLRHPRKLCRSSSQAPAKGRKL
jgi:hypothetical protein